MSNINSAVFNAGSGGTVAVYNQGDPIELTINYTPDVASVVATPLTATTTITNAAGQVTFSVDSPFTVNVPQAGGDTVGESDTGSHTWTAGATSPQSDGSLTVVESTTA